MSFLKTGILGGGQLGKMLCQAASVWHYPIFCMDKSLDSPAAPYCHGFTAGDFKNYDDVFHFGKNMDVITIEIEHVNTDAMRALQQMGKQVHPAPDALDIIKDKGLQKQFYANNGLPTSPFRLLENAAQVRQAIESGIIKIPFVQKSRTAGYDGKGVAVIRNTTDLAEKLMDTPCVIEDLVDIHQEIAVVVAQNPSGEIAAFDAVEMEFHPTANLVEFLVCPAHITPEQAKTAEHLATTVIQKMNICGLLAVELFIDKKGDILINEVAPRPHNSGHHTIDAAVTSQFEQHLRGVLDLPLGSTRQTSPAVMVNLLGAADSPIGTTQYLNWKKCLELPGVHLHFYGKSTSRPFRKMGHATITADTLEAAKKIARQVQSRLKIVGQ